MSTVRSDAFVFFGATGDLAFKKIFPALQAMIRRGHLDVPIIGVAKAGGLEQLRAAGARQPRKARRRVDRARSRSWCRCCATSTATTRIRRRSTGCAASSAIVGAPAALPGDPAEPVRDRRPTALARERLRAQRAGRGRETVRSRPRLGTGAQRHARTACSPSLTSFASTTISARSRSRTCSSSVSPTRSSSRSGIATTSRASRSRWPRASASQGRGKFYEEAGAIRDVMQNHMLQVLGLLAMEAPIVGLSRVDARRADQGPPDDPAARAGEPRARSVSRLPREEGVAPKSQVETFAAVRLMIDSWRWDGVPFYIRAGKCLPVTTTEVVVYLKRPPLVDAGTRTRNYVRFRLSPDVVIAVGAHVKQAGETDGGRSTELSFVDKPEGDEMDPYERLLGDAMEGTRRSSRVRTPSRRRGRSSIRFSATRRRSTSTSPAPGDPRRRTDSTLSPAAGTARRLRSPILDLTDLAASRRAAASRRRAACAPPVPRSPRSAGRGRGPACRGRARRSSGAGGWTLSLRSARQRTDDDNRTGLSYHFFFSTCVSIQSTITDESNPDLARDT